jgi:hypothetical protein
MRERVVRGVAAAVGATFLRLRVDSAAAGERASSIDASVVDLEEGAEAGLRGLGLGIDGVRGTSGRTPR